MAFTPLLPDEKLLWSGRPAQGLRLSPRDALLIPFSLMWGGFAVVWEATALTSHGPWFFRLWGIPFVLVGFYLMLGRFFVDAWLRRQTYYAVTDGRVLIQRIGPFPSLTILKLDALPSMRLTGQTIWFGAPIRGRAFANWTPALDPTPHLADIADAAEVFGILQHLKEEKDVLS